MSLRQQLIPQRHVRVIVSEVTFVEIKGVHDLQPKGTTKGKVLREVKLPKYGEYLLRGEALDKYRRRFRFKTPTVKEVKNLEMDAQDRVAWLERKQVTTVRTNVGLALEEALTK